jgi:hypothetical protein
MKIWLVAAALVLATGPATADVLTTLDDMNLFQKSEKDVQVINSLAELDALNETISTCSAAGLGQHQQQFECERDVKRYWAHYNRGRALDSYVSAIGALFEGFDSTGINPPESMVSAYKHAATNMIALLHDINSRYGQLEKPR